MTPSGITSADWPELDEPLHTPLAIAMLGQQLDFSLDYGTLSRMLGPLASGLPMDYPEYCKVRD